MAFSKEQIEELNVLLQFNLNSAMRGIKVHKSARPEMIEAIQRLYEKGMLTQVDGGYLTDLGQKATDHTQALLTMLMPARQMAS
jgi:uncharacterized protein (TIGR02647 family)